MDGLTWRFYFTGPNTERRFYGLSIDSCNRTAGCETGTDRV